VERKPGSGTVEVLARPLRGPVIYKPAMNTNGSADVVPTGGVTVTVSLLNGNGTTSPLLHADIFFEW